jgi:hypothetical protein
MAIIRRTWFLIFIGVLIAVIGASAAVLLATRTQSKIESDPLVPLAARIDKIDGTVGIDNQLSDQTGNQTESSQGQQPAANAGPGSADDQGASGTVAASGVGSAVGAAPGVQPSTNTDWIAPSVNTPLSVGQRVYVHDRSHAGLAFSGRNYVRLNPNTELDVLSLAERRTQLALREGSGIFDIGALAPGELCEVDTPYGAVDFDQPGLYQVGIEDDDAMVTVLSGQAQVVGVDGTGQCNRGQELTLTGAADQAADQAYVADVAPDVCGGIVNDYYGYRYPSDYDGRYANYNTYLSDPYYYDPYRRSASYQYVADEEDIAGLNDLDSYGDWSDVAGYGNCWHPRVDAGWAPYQSGYWLNDYPLGLTWVSSEPWGWAPYHYGRWAFVNGGWYWVPAEAIARPVYAPALCAFVPLTQFNEIGWCPLGPGDPFVPRYYDAGFRPWYIGSTFFVNRSIGFTRFANFNVPGACTVVPVSGFAGVISPRTIVRVDPRTLGRFRPVADPFAVPALRQGAFNTLAMRPKVQVPTQVAFNRAVVASNSPALPRAIANSGMARAFQVQPTPRAALKQKLQINNSGQVVAERQPNGLPARPGRFAGQPGQAGLTNQAAIDQQRQTQIQALSQRAAQGDRAAGRQMRQLQGQQQVEDRMARRSANQQAAAQQQTAAQQAREQARTQRAQQQGAQQQQIQQQRLAERQARQQQQQRNATRQQQAQQQRQAERQARQQQDAARQQQMQQQRQAQRQAAQQQQMQQQRQAQRQAAQQQQMQQQRQAQRQAAQQQQMQQQRQADRQRQQQQQDAMRQQQMQQQRQADRQRQQQQQDAMRQQQMQQRQAAQQQQMQQQRQAERQMRQQQQSAPQRQAPPPQRQAAPQRQSPPPSGGGDRRPPKRPQG